jgi:MoaA/NifB/PqqE/SkfB family radical SAM enzyme
MIVSEKTSVESNKELNLSEIKAGKVELQSKPIVFDIDLTGKCNINPPCVFCALKDEGYNYNPLDVNYLGDYLEFFSQTETINDCSFGEPLSHPKFLDLVQRVTGNGQIFGFATNALLLNSEKADVLVKCGDSIRMVVSVNAATKETYYKLNGKDFNKLTGNLNYFIDHYRKSHGNRDPHIAFSMVVMKINRDEVGNFIRLAHGMGVKNVILRQLFEIPSMDNVRNDWGYHFVYKDEILSADELKRVTGESRAVAEDLGVNLSIQWESTNSEIGRYAEEGVDIPCLLPWKMLFVQEHSKNVYICCYSSGAVGNLMKTSIDQVWNAETVKKVRQSLIRGEIPEFCRRHGTNCALVNEWKQKESEIGGKSVSINTLRSSMASRLLRRLKTFLSSTGDVN